MKEILALVAAVTPGYLAILALYRWQDSRNDAMERRMSDHVNDASKHTPSNELVFRDVCDERVKRIEQGQAAIQSEMRSGFDRLENAIKNGK